MLKVKLYTVIILSITIVALFITNCGDTSGPDENPLVGTWDLTQLIISSAIFTDTLTPGVDTVSGTMTLNDDNTFSYSLDIDHTFIIGTNQVPLDTTMSSSGNWSSTDTTITLDDPQVGEQTSSYEISGNTMKTTGSMEISTPIGAVDVALIQTWAKQ